MTVKSGLDELVSDLLQEAHSDLERVRAIWIWICHHIGRPTCGATALGSLDATSCWPLFPGEGLWDSLDHSVWSEMEGGGEGFPDGWVE